MKMRDYVQCKATVDLKKVFYSWFKSEISCTALDIFSELDDRLSCWNQNYYR